MSGNTIIKKVVQNKLIFVCITSGLLILSKPVLVTAASFGPLTFEQPWDFPDSSVVANELTVAQMVENEKNLANGANGAVGAAGAGGGGSGGICSPGSNQSVFNCVVTVNTTQIQGSQLTNTSNNNSNGVTDPSQLNSGSSNNLAPTP